MGFWGFGVLGFGVWGLEYRDINALMMNVQIIEEICLATFSLSLFQTRRKMPATERLVRLAAGPHVLAKAQIIERISTRMN